MNTLQRIIAALGEADSALAEQLRDAVANQQYEDVSLIADVLGKIADIRSSLSRKSRKLTRPVSGSPGDDPVVAPTISPKVQSGMSDSEKAAVQKPRSNLNSTYPKFVREEDRLVKVGWSKKKNKEYEHRVPKEAVFGFLRHLDRNVGQAKVFEIDDLVPVLSESGDEVPGYQIYVIVAWLRELRILEKKGRDGYLIRDKSILVGDLDGIWHGIQTRTA